MRFSLRWKILILAVFSPLILAAGSLTLVNKRVSKNIEANIREDLDRSSLMCQSFLESRVKMLEASATVIAQDPRFFASVAIPGSSQDPEYRATVQGVAVDFNKIATADIFDVLDPAGRLVASSGTTTTTRPGRASLLHALRNGEPVPNLLTEDGTLFLVSLRQMKLDGRTIGLLLLGMRMGNELASELRALTRSEVSILSAGKLSGTTLELDETQHLLHAIDHSLGLERGLPLRGVFALWQNGATYLTLARPLPGAGPISEELFILQRSLREESVFLHDIQRGLTELGLLILMVTLFLGLLISHKITRPILDLVLAAEEIERGNYTHPLHIHTRDEIEYLASKFEEMRNHERTYVRNLQDVAQLKSNFIDLASHELRTPTTVMMGYTELLAQGTLGRTTVRQRKALEAMDTNLRAIVRIAEKATDVAQLEGERPMLNCQRTDVFSILMEAAEMAIGEAPERQVEVTVELEEESLYAEVDESRVIQAVAHLVRNGIRFTPDGGSVTLGAVRGDSELLIRVRDTGVGISPENCGKLFEHSLLVRDVPHHHSSSGLEFGSSGLGLGLPVAHGIVRAHGGSITVSSREGKGSTFTIHLPVESLSETARAA